MNLAALILAAGLGTRMKSDRAKVLHELGGKPLAAYPVELALSLKAKPVVVVVGRQAETVSALLADRYGDAVRTALQKEQLGTGHAVMAAESALRGFSGTVAILSGDAPLLARETVAALVRQTVRRKSPLGILISTLDDPTGYGRVLRDPSGRVRRVVEQKDASADELAVREANMGVYAVQAKFLFAALKRIGRDNAQGEYYLPDLVRLAAEAGHEVVAVEAPGEETLGVNDRRQLAQLEKILQRRTNERLMAAGVTIRDPETTWIDAGAKIGRDTVIEPFCRIAGESEIGENCAIGMGSVIDGARLALKGLIARPDGSRVVSGARDGAVSDAARLGRDLGAYLRAEAGPGFLPGF